IAMMALLVLAILPVSQAHALVVSLATVTPSSDSVAQYDIISFTAPLNNVSATTPQFPYDATGANGIPPATGITFDGQFLPPGQTDWDLAIVQPGFLYQPYTETPTKLGYSAYATTGWL